jgi:hypothetical protein
MRARLILATLCIAAVAALPALSKAAGDDWILIKATAGEGGTSQGISIGIHGTGLTTGADELILGYGIGTPDFSFLNLANMGKDGIHADTSADLGAQHVEVTPPDAAGEFELGVGIGTGATLAEGESIGIVIWVTGATITGLDLASVTAGSGTFSTTTSSGSGSRALAVADPSRNGPAVSAGSLGAGVASVDETTASGLVGAVEWLCEVCMGSWTAPDGRTGSWTANGNNLVAAGSWGAGGPVSFSGPDGAWNWSWTGVTTANGITLAQPGAPVIAAYAPIGDDWTLFTT